MSFQIYVGNYPKEFTEEDLNRLFLDFDGIRLVKFFKAEKKCFAFFYCLNREQVIDVCLKMNNLHVGGRKLIVRATDDDLQSFIKSKFEYLNESSSSVGSANDYKNYTQERISYSDMPKLEPFNMYGTSASSEYSSNIYPYVSHNREANTQTSQSKINLRETNPSPNISLSERFGKFKSTESNTFSASPQFHSQAYEETYNHKRNVHATDSFLEMPHSESFNMHGNLATNSSKPLMHYSAKSYDHKVNYQGMQSFSDVSPVEHLNAHTNFPQNMYSKNEQFYAGHKGNSIKHSNAYNSGIYDGNGQCSSFNDPSTSESHHHYHQQQTKLDTAFYDAKLSYVSVMNFPIGTTTEELFNLFSPFNPIEIIFKCNVARRDRTPTEAVIYFSHKQDATNAILNLDNTRYRNRNILVNDVDDLTMAMELLSVAGKH